MRNIMTTEQKSILTKHEVDKLIKVADKVCGPLDELIKVAAKPCGPLYELIKVADKVCGPLE
jgi:hypothetical protein